MNDYLIRFALLRERAYCEPDNHGLFRHLMICTELLGNYAETRELYAHLLDEHPYCGYAWYNLGWTCLQLEAPEDALEAFEYAYITLPNFEEAYRAFSELAFQRGQYRRALQCYLEWKSRADADIEVFARIAECYRLLGDVPAAKKMCRLALQADAEHAEVCYQMGACFMAEQDYRQASLWLRKAIRLDDNREEIHSLLAAAYGYLGQGRKALAHLWRSVELAPEEAVRWLQLAEFLLLAGELDEAGEVLEQALENASSAELLYCTAAYFFLSNQRQSAVHVLEQALTADLSRCPDIVFRWAPALRDDAEIQGLFSGYQG